MIYLDNAATTSPKPIVVTQALLEGVKMSANPGRGGHDMSVRASFEVFETRKALSDFFSLKKPENVIFTSNCTQSLNMAINGLIPENSHVICSDLEHNSVIRVLEKLKREGKLTYSIAKTFESDIETVRSFEKEINSKTSAVVCVHSSNVFGNILPIEKIGAMCRKRNLIFIVDAAQSAGVIPIDMDKCGISALCVPGHKGLYGSMGTGALLLENEKIKPLIVGGTGNESSSPIQPEGLPERLESGTVNLPGIMSLKAGVQFVRNIGCDRIHRYEKALCGELCEFLMNDKRFEIFSPVHCLNTTAVISFRHRNMHSEETADYLNSCGICVRAGYHCSYLAHKSRGSEDSGLVRVSPGMFNNEIHIKKLINCLNKIEK